MNIIKHEYKKLHKRIDEVLFYIWDPIGVAWSPQARNEYENYVPQILEQVIKNDKVEPISDYLANIVKREMELAPDKRICDTTAEMLLEYKYVICELGIT